MSNGPLRVVQGRHGCATTFVTVVVFKGRENGRQLNLGVVDACIGGGFVLSPTGRLGGR